MHERLEVQELFRRKLTHRELSAEQARPLKAGADSTVRGSSAGNTMASGGYYGDREGGLFADVVGYRGSWKQTRKARWRAERHGRVVKLVGDTLPAPPMPCVARLVCTRGWQGT